MKVREGSLMIVQRKKNLPWRLVPMSEEHARQICEWRYEGPYAIYNWSTWEELCRKQEEFADPEIRVQQYLSAITDGTEAAGPTDTTEQLCGFAQLFPLVGITRLGLGLRPDLCGCGIGSAFVELIAQEACNRQPANEIDLEVLVWNTRAIKAYERAGFHITDTYERGTPTGPDIFHCMVYNP
jgi:ribosomal protein S18 acetylase RimI-like enzyme